MEPTLPQYPYISSVEAAKRFDITNDYAAALCRQGKVEGKLIGRLWFVNEASLRAYLERMREQRQAQRKGLSSAWRHAWTALLILVVIMAPPAHADGLGLHANDTLADLPDAMIDATLNAELVLGQGYWQAINAYIAVTRGALDMTAAAYNQGIGNFVSLTYIARDLSAAVYGGIATSFVGRLASVHDSQVRTMQAMADSMADGAVEAGTAYQALAQWYTQSGARIKQRFESEQSGSVSATLPTTASAVVAAEALQSVPAQVAQSLSLATKATDSPAPTIIYMPATTTSDYVTQTDLSVQLAALKAELTQLIVVRSTATEGVQVPQQIAGGGYGAVFNAEPAPPAQPSQIIAQITASDIPPLNYFPATSTVSIAYGGTGTSTAPEANQLLLSDADGNWEYVGTSSLGISGGNVGADFAWTATTNFGAAANATSTPIWFQSGLQASSTSQLASVFVGGLGFNATTSTSTLATFGGRSLIVASTTAFNTGLGLNTLAVVTSGKSNTAFGNDALNTVTTGSFNTAFGDSAGGNNTGSNNTAIGYGALNPDAASTGSGNTVVGSQVADSGNNSGSNNTLLGYAIIGGGLSGSENIGIGHKVFSTGDLTGSNNIGLGTYAFGYNGIVAGNYNIGIGYGASAETTSGFGNLFLGYQSGLTPGYANQTGFNNIALGYNAFLPSATGNNQLSIGNLIFGTLPATSTVVNESTGALTLPTSGSIGIGTTSPFAKFSIALNNGDTTGTAFAIGSSTASATTTLFSISNTGAANILKSLSVATTSSAASLTLQGSATITGSELITNGTFTGGSTGWTVGSCWAYSNNQMTYTYSGCGGAAIMQNLTTTAGHTYLMQMDVSGASADQPTIELALGDTFSSQPLGNGHNQFLFTSHHTGTSQFEISATTYASGASFSVDNVSVKEVSNTPALHAYAWDGTSLIGSLGGDGSGENFALGYGALASSSLSGMYNMAVGENALAVTSSGTYNTALGYRAGYANTTGQDNIFIGYGAGSSNTTGQDNTFVGGGGANTIGNANVTIGAALSYNTTGGSNVAIGEGASAGNTSATSTVAIGVYAGDGGGGYSFHAQGYTVLGAQAGEFFQTGADYNTLLGYRAGQNVTKGYSNIMVGATASCCMAMNITTGSGNIGLGNDLFFPSATANNQLDIGGFLFGTLPATSSNFVLPTSGALGVGTSSPFAKFSIALNNGDTAGTAFAIGSSTASATTTLFAVSNRGQLALNTNTTTSTIATLFGRSLLITSAPNLNTGLGLDTLSSDSLGWANTAVGYQALVANTSGSMNTANGSSALAANTSGQQNTASGLVALGANTTGSNNVANGASALSSNTTGGNNTANGTYALSSNTTGANNTAIGYSAGRNTTTGYSNLFLGDFTSFSGSITSGSHNIGIGSDIFFPSATANNQLNIGNLLFGTLPATTTSFQLPTSGALGVGTSSPYAKFSIALNSGDTTGTAFAIGSSTASATTTLFSINNLGQLALNTNTTTSTIATLFGRSFIVASTSPLAFKGKNTGLGLDALSKISSGFDNSAFGESAGSNLTTGSDNTLIGDFAGLITSASRNTFVGSAAGDQACGAEAAGNDDNVGVGYYALGCSNAAARTIAIGNNVFGGGGTESDVIAIGHNVLSQTWTPSSNSVVIGSQAAYKAGGMQFSTILGYEAGYNFDGTSGGYGNILIGASSTNDLINGSNNIVLGNNTHLPSSSTNNELNIGGLLFGTLPATSTAFQLPTSGALGVGTSSPFAKLSIALNNGDTTDTAFAIGSSTANSTTTLFSITNTGNTSIAGSLTVLGNLSLGNFNEDSTATCGNTYHTFIGPIGTVGGDECAALNVTQPDANGNIIYRFGPANGTWAGEFYANSTVVGLNTKSAVPVTFEINGSEKMRLSSSGYLGINTTNPGNYLAVSTSTNLGTLSLEYNGAAQYGAGFNDTDSGSSGHTVINFLRNDGQVGQISITNTATTYNTTSDRRLKENIATSTEGLSTLLQIPVRNFDFIKDPSHTQTQGFIAQELYQYYPEAVTPNGDNGTVPLGATSTPWAVDYGRLTPLIVKSIQDIADLSETFKDTLIAWLGNTENGITKLFAREVHTHELCVADDSGAETCITKAQLDQLLAGAAAGTPAPQTAAATSTGDIATSTNATSTPDTEAPVITLNGATSVTISTGATYIDPGATVSDNINKNLGYKVSLDGVATTSPDQMSLDTSTPGEHIITYSATDQAGNTGYASRTVVVAAPIGFATSTPALDAGEATSSIATSTTS